MGIALAGSLAVLGGTVVALGLPQGTPGSSGPSRQARAVPSESGEQSPSAAAPVQPASTPPPAPAPAPAGTPTGTFVTAAANGPAVGKGKIRRYRVEVENGIGIDPQAAAGEVQAILADKRGWTTDGRTGFQLVADGAYDFTIKIASPGTTDRICATAGLNTQGEVNCDVGDQVMVNSKRWETGSPQFTGPIEEYRALIVNHEVGHRIGHGHEGCPGPGKPAPAMMQQIYGLNGCTPNAWPYSADGKYLSGPKVA
ncbi:DUF3152 domain-containing protein [Kitasatospora sp. NPDC048540]|uniref:DUF3152 domain-containing protein n=1 Tax=unclassified Kitasatospora TaxID=2633591 RepID=UPI000B216EBC|nr:DUF3152 domain-containing protein [Kitasatospora sp. MBT63]